MMTNLIKTISKLWASLTGQPQVDTAKRERASTYISIRLLITLTYEFIENR